MKLNTTIQTTLSPGAISERLLPSVLLAYAEYFLNVTHSKALRSGGAFLSRSGNSRSARALSTPAPATTAKYRGLKQPVGGWLAAPSHRNTYGAYILGKSPALLGAPRLGGNISSVNAVNTLVCTAARNVAPTQLGLAFSDSLWRAARLVNCQATTRWQSTSLGKPEVKGRLPTDFFYQH